MAGFNPQINNDQPPSFADFVNQQQEQEKADFNVTHNGAGQSFSEYLNSQRTGADDKTLPPARIPSFSDYVSQKSPSQDDQPLSARVAGKGSAGWGISRGPAAPVNKPEKFDPDKPNFKQGTPGYIYNDTTLAPIVKQFYKERDGKTFDSDGQAIDYLLSDRTWKSGYTPSALGELNYATGVIGKQASPSQLQRLGYLRSYINAMPTIFEEGGRDIVPTMAKYAGMGLIDPVNLVGMGAGKAFGKLIGAGSSIATDAITNAAIDAINQKIDINSGQRDGFDPWEVVTAAGVGAGAHVVGAGVSAGVGGAIRTIKPKSVFSSDLAKFKEAKIGPDPNEGEPINLQGKIGDFIQGVFDNWNPFAAYQKRITGVGRTIGSLHQATDALKADPNALPVNKDPALLPYFQLSQLSSSLARVKHLFTVGGILPPDQDAAVGTAAYKHVADVPAVGKVLQPFIDNGSAGDFMYYLLAKRAQNIQSVRNPARLAAGLKPIETMFNDVDYWLGLGHTQQQAEAMASTTADRVVGQGDVMPGWQDAANEWTKITDNFLQYQKESGYLSDADMSNILKAAGGAPYVPSYPASDRAATVDRVAGAATAPNAPARARLKGNTGNVAPLLDAFMNYAEKAIRSSDINRAKQSFYDMMDQGVAAGDKFAAAAYEYVPERERMSLFNIFYNSAKKSLKNAGADVEDDLDRLKNTINPTTGSNYTTSEAMNHLMFTGGNAPPDFIEAFGMANRPKDMKDVDVFFRDGQIQFVRVKDQGLVSALQGMHGDFGSSWGMQMMSKLRKVYSGFITANPLFSIHNVERDSAAAGINSEFGNIPYLSWLNGMRLQAVDNEKYRQFLVNGAGGAGMVKSEFLDSAARSQEAYQKDPFVTRYMKGAMDYLHNNYFNRGYAGYHDFLERMEMGIRFNEYNAALKAGMSPLTAGYAGQEVSTNFSRHGSSNVVRFFTSTTPFLNAGLQGVYKVGTTAADHQVRTPAMIAGMIMAPALISHVANQGNPVYDDIPEPIKRSNLWFPVYKDHTAALAWYKSGGVGKPPEVDRYIPVPLPYDYGGFASLATTTFDAIKDHSGAKAAYGFLSSLQGMLPGLSAPVGVAAALQLGLNRDWKGSPIVPSYLDGKQPIEQVTERTSEWSKWVVGEIERLSRPNEEPIFGKAADGQFRQRGMQPFSPLQVDYAANYLMTGIMNYPMQAIDQIQRESEVGTRGVRPAARPDEFDYSRPWTAITRGLVYGAPNRNSASLQQFYDLQKRAEQLNPDQRNTEAGFDAIVNPGNQYKADEVQSAYGFVDTIKDAAGVLQQLREKYKQIENSTAITDPNEKRKLLDENITQRNAFAREINSQILSLRQADPLTGERFDQNKSLHQGVRATPAWYWLTHGFKAEPGATDLSKQTNDMLNEYRGSQ